MAWPRKEPPILNGVSFQLPVSLPGGVQRTPRSPSGAGALCSPRGAISLSDFCRRGKHQRVLYPSSSSNASARTVQRSSCASTCAAAAAEAAWPICTSLRVSPIPRNPKSMTDVRQHGEEYAEAPRRQASQCNTARGYEELKEIA